jgi:PAS domain S-box-containing protein
MSPLSLRARLALQTGVLLGLMALLGLVFLAELRGVSRALDSVYEDRLVPMQQLRQLSHSVRAEMPAQLARLAAGRQTAAAAREALAAEQREQERLWLAYKNTYLVEEEIHLIARAEPQLRYVQEALQRLLRQLESGQGAGSDQLAHALDDATGPLVATLDQLIDVQLLVARRAADAGRAAAERARWQLALALLGSAVLAVLLAAWVWSSHRRAQRLAEAAEHRVQQFYVALSQCNQLIVRDPESARQLYEGMCRICVETGRALLAAVIETDGRSARRVAAHGPVERLLEGVPAAWELDSAYGQISLTAQVMRSGEHLISNDAALDPRMSHWHGTVVARGAQAMAAFPLRRGGAVVGSLLIFGAERGYFDAALVRLLDEMAGDLSFALDNLERERQRTQALAEAEAGRDLFRRLFNASAVSTAVTALADGRVLAVNDLLCQRYGVAREELVGRRMSELGVGLCEEDRARYYALLQAHGRVQNLELRARNRAGELLYSLVGGEIVDFQGQRSVLSVSVDITELRRARGGVP